MSFELTECAAAYASDLARRIDAELRGRASPTPARDVSRSDDADADAPFDAVRDVVQAQQRRILDHLRRVFAEEMELAALPDPDELIGALGVDSLRAVLIHTRIAEESGIDLPPALFAEIGSLRTMADWLVGRLAAPETGTAPVIWRDPAGGDAETLALLELLANESEEIA